VFSDKFIQALDAVTKKVPEGDQEAKLEFVKQMRELGWFERVTNLYRIKGKLSGEFNFFRPNQDQSHFLTTRSGHDIILKSRQIGFTTLMCIYNYDRALWDNWDTGIMSHLRERTELIFEIVKNCNEWFKKDWGHLFNREQSSDSAHKISFDGGGSVSVSYDFQSLTLKSLHISEAAFIDANRIGNSIQSVPENGEVTLESTPNGRGGFFYESWQGWKKNGNLAPYKGFFFPWFKHYPEDIDKWETIASNAKMNLDDREDELVTVYGLKKYQLAWRRWKIQESFQGSEENFEVHYPVDDVACFLSGENRVFSASVMKYQESFVKEPSFIGNLSDGLKETKSGFWKIWEVPNVSASYVIGVDCSEGIGKDRGVISVWNRNTGYQVAELVAQLPPDLLSDEAYKASIYYQQAWICPEANNHGHSFISSLTKKNFYKIYKRQAIDEITNKPTQKLGFLTTSTTKMPLTENFAVKCRSGEIKIRSSHLLNEMSTFIQISSQTGRTVRREAISGCYDDSVIAACLAMEMDRVLGTTTDASEFWLKEQELNQKIDDETGFVVPSDLYEPN